MFRTIVVPMIAGLLSFVTSGASDVCAAENFNTSISIDGMHCAGCAKKIASRLKTVSGVADAEVNVETGTAAVTPKSKATLSPRALWEAIEKAGYTPSKLAGPSGTFTKKPEK
jgi:copper chaperone CopZ